VSDVAVLEEIQRRVLWLAVRMVDAANRDRQVTDGLKVGGHQASSASLVTALTALYFSHLDPDDRVSVKPHASPAFHAVQYLLGNLEESYLRSLRAFGGLQSYPSRTKDPDGVDFSTGSVGLGAAAPLFAAVSRRYVDQHFGPRPRSRFIALMGDAELDEGNVWEAIADPVTVGLGNVLWVVDFNRQSLDRVVPGIKIFQLHQQFEAAGWHVVEVKYGKRLTRAFAELPQGALLRSWIDDMSNEHYQALFGLAPAELRKRFLDGAPHDLERALEPIPDADLATLIQDLGGHDLDAMRDAYRAADLVTDRPTVIFAYTVKGWGLPIAGNPRNHAQMLTREQIDHLRAAFGIDPDREWARFDPESAAGAWCRDRGTHLRRAAGTPHAAIVLPARTQRPQSRPVATQEAFGRVLVELARDPNVAPHLVTTAPDVAVSTNLAGWINKVGVFAPREMVSWAGEDTLLRWQESPSGQHIELGISEMNLFLLLGQLGLAWDLSAQPLLPVGTVYDPFVCRGLDALIYAVYNGGRFVFAGTPSGVTLAPEGGAHQSTITASIGVELPGVTLCEPAYVGALDWLLCDALQRVADGAPDAVTYLRLTTRAIDQSPFEAARERYGDAELRRQVLRGGYVLRQEGGDVASVVQLAASGAVLPEVLLAAEELQDEGVSARVVDVTSQDRLFREWRQSIRRSLRTGHLPAPSFIADLFVPGAPIVSVHDASSHSMAWLGSAAGVPCTPLGVDSFGQSGTVDDLYAEHELSAGYVVNAALCALSGTEANR
jgi:pyruvate dehydrogenase E1 component